MRKRRNRILRVKNTWIIGIVAICVAGILVVVSLTSARVPSSTSYSALDKCGNPVCGSVNAPVTVEIYSDFQ
jgi:hypothetical protein